MASDSMRTLLSVTLAGCFVKGTSVTESGLTVSTNTLPGETILFFKTDSNAGRECLGITGENLFVFVCMVRLQEMNKKLGMSSKRYLSNMCA